LGYGLNLRGDIALLIKFIAITYVAFAAVQIVIALTSEIQKGIFKMFQWMFWALIAIFAWLGA